MKRQLLITLLSILVFSLTSTAQRRPRSGLGYMGGPQATNWHSEGAVYRTVPGLVVGFYAPIWAARRIEIQPDLLLSLGGTTRELPESDRVTMRTLYATAPISFKYFLTHEFNLQVGVQGGYLLIANLDGENAKHQLNPLDLGVNVGLGIGNWKGVDFTLRYYNGLSNTLPDDQFLFPATRSLQLTVGKRFMQFSHRRFRRG